MSGNLNEDVYKRFGLEVDRGLVVRGFKKYVASKIWEALKLFRSPDWYEQEFRNEIYKSRENFLDDCCREMFLDRSDYDYESYDNKKISTFVDDLLEGSFEEMLVRIQILLNTFYRYDIAHEEMDVLAKELATYTNDFPILGILVKEYKTKAPQILPAGSKRHNKELLDTLGVLDAQEFSVALTDFESAVRNFTKAKTDSDMKSVVATIHAACDEVVKVVLDDEHKSFKNVTDKEDHKRLGLNGEQKEMFKHLKNRMDAIKHGGSKNIDRAEVEMIISVAAAFIRFAAVKYVKDHSK